MLDHSGEQPMRDELLHRLTGPPMTEERASELLDAVMHEAAVWMRWHVDGHRHTGRTLDPLWLIDTIDPYAN